MSTAAAGGTIGLVYFFDTAEREERRRLEAQTSLWDPFTFRRLEEIGVGEGWRCLEVGGGTGSVAAWLRERAGVVVATDVETRWLEPLAGVEVRRHDVVADPLEEAAYDLIHVRLVLMHLPERDAVLAKLVGALRPGGWLVVDDYDLGVIGTAHPPNAAWLAVARASSDVLESVGADAAYGGRLPTALRSAGLADVQAEGQVLLLRPPELAPLLVPMLERMRAPMLAAGAVSAADYEEVMRELADAQSPLSVFSPIMVSARGRRFPW
jgi:SAM-dependent methyltransferase